MDQHLFETIDTTIREERLYAKVDLMREDIMNRFNVSRHRLNAILNLHADGKSFPQYINTIRLEEAHKLLTNHPEKTIYQIADIVGFTAPNLRQQFKRKYGVTPSEYLKSRQYYPFRLAYLSTKC
jgi:AraC-like DNA-binding protein